MGNDVVGFAEIDLAQIAGVGGKGANLGELSRIDGIRVPPGFCVTTDAFTRVVVDAPTIQERLDRLSLLDTDDQESIRTLGAEIRGAIEALSVPADLAAEITGELRRLGEQSWSAVRSSATAEDLPTASFAGQQDSYLNVIGPESVVRHVSRCWASLFTERAVAYRQQHGFDHREVRMAVVVQRMVEPRGAGVLFTADPMTSNRTITSVEAVAGLGDDLVSGLVTPDRFTVRDGAVVGSETLGERPVVTDVQVVHLAELGRRIEAHFGRPQDIEWCLDDDGFQFVQSRSITTLFPVPVVDDEEVHVYLSVGHQQMMTDPMKPLGLSMWQMTAAPRMYEAGGRLFVDVAQALASPARAGLMEMVGKGDPLTGDALESIIGREGFIPTPPETGAVASPAAGPTSGAPAPIETDPAVVAGLVEAREVSLAALQREIATRSGAELFDFIVEDIGEMKQLVFDPLSSQVVMGGMEATWWLNDQLEEWLGEKNAADALTQSLPDNVTAEMGLALLDVADVVRPYPEVVAFLQTVEDAGDDGFLDELPGLDGGIEARDAIRAFLDRYGMRCVGEIDITRPRWGERPSTIVPMILGNVRNAEPGAAHRRFEQGLAEFEAKQRDVLARLRDLPDGEAKAVETVRMIDRARAFNGYREYPKFVIVNRHFAYKQALLREVDRLVEAGVLRDREDAFFLTFAELHDVVRGKDPDVGVVEARKDAFRSYSSLTPPRVLTSEGEVVAGAYRRDDVPSGALPGLAVSAGTIEGRARVLHDVAEAELEPGDVLVTAYTDPSWTPVFVTIAGLVTEVGGLMTHGAVIAREYGLPAVVGVQRATGLIRDGQRIRVHGTDGYVELLSD